MREYQTTAFILSKQDSGEFDETLSLYCKDIGKIYAFAKSSRKLNSKLASHLQVQQKVSLRLIEKNRMQIADSLSLPIANSNTLAILWILERLSTNEDFDKRVWDFLNQGQSLKRELLKILGFDIQFARCLLCEGQSVQLFSLSQQRYLCQACAYKYPNQRFILVE